MNALSCLISLTQVHKVWTQMSNPTYFIVYFRMKYLSCIHKLPSKSACLESLSLSVSAEVPLVLFLFLLISLVWLWAGLHMAYKDLWMLVLYVVFNCLLVSPTTDSSRSVLCMLFVPPPASSPCCTSPFVVHWDVRAFRCSLIEGSALFL